MFSSDEFSQRYRDPRGAEGVDKQRRAQREQLLRELKNTGPGLGTQLLDLFQTLPAALRDAQRLELARLRKRYGDKDPRVQDRAEAVEALAELDAGVQQGARRAHRLIALIGIEGRVFHGFVVDTVGEPLPGLRVELLSLRQQTVGSALTADDGYFQMLLPSTDTRDPKDRETIAQMNVQLRARDGSLLYADPLPVEFDGGSVYREYAIARPEPGCRDPREKPPLDSSTPLEHVRGIGPKRAARLREAGIVDLESLLRADTDRLVEILGFDIGPTREEAERVLAEHRAVAQGKSEHDTGEQNSATADADKATPSAPAAPPSTAANAEPPAKPGRGRKA